MIPERGLPNKLGKTDEKTVLLPRVEDR